MSLNSPPDPIKANYTQRTPLSLSLFHGYRVLLCSTLIILPMFALLPSDYNTTLYAGTASFYCLITVLTILFQGIQEKRYIHYRREVIFITDIIGLTLIVHATGGVQYGFATLLIIPLSFSSADSQHNRCFLHAALASLLIILDTLIFSANSNDSGHYTQAGLYGLIFFATAILVNRLSTRLKVTANLAEQHYHQMLTLETINQSIVQQLKTGLVLIDKNQDVLLVNAKAWHLLDCQTRAVLPQPIAQCFPALHRLLLDNSKSRYIQVEVPHCVNIRIDYIDNDLRIILLEDNQEIQKQAQEIKLASLGRFTASIAHEIRNPLYAIHHAVQLMQEEIQRSQEDKKLLRIIQEHCERLNLIVNNTLELSQYRPAKVSEFDIIGWLHQFSANFTTSCVPNHHLNVQSGLKQLIVEFDKIQLEQILTNLINNGLAQGYKHCGDTQICISIIQDDDEYYLIHIIDSGPGVETTDIDKIFEPFYTTSPNGTGLGLYIAKLLANANRAQLYYNEDYRMNSCFTLRLPGKQA